MLVDFVSYSGEYDMLKARLEHMRADLTVVYEGDRSYTGLEKPLAGIGDLAAENVLYYAITGETSPDPWANEYAQRRKAFEYLLSLELSDDDILCVSDVDEFPDPELLKITPELSVWNMAKFQMSARWFQQIENTSVSGSFKHFKDKDIIGVMWGRSGLNHLNAGWHFSSFMSLEDLIQKWQHISHTELVRENMSDWVTHCWVNGLAVENGNAMTELDNFDSLPKAIVTGPKHWFRSRNDS